MNDAPRQKLHELIVEYGRSLCDDPRSLELDARRRANLHVKCVVVDRQVVFVSSANFTEAVQERNIEVGVLLRFRYGTTEKCG
jgi:phosphatidylserine/phosphatidylglycerophosphate/cardiolipin synthase-like enzyme